ncbi:hypothetical protein AAG570_001207 [Ranatra chinensis]|uniref:Uncharacterized protein n=1 Tax=Ranatra chinensis TaxID=642074 RepID=A0ABD0YXN4_9HEMI
MEPSTLRAAISRNSRIFGPLQNLWGMLSSSLLFKHTSGSRWKSPKNPDKDKLLKATMDRLAKVRKQDEQNKWPFIKLLGGPEKERTIQVIWGEERAQLARKGKRRSGNEDYFHGNWKALDSRLKVSQDHQDYAEDSGTTGDYFDKLLAPPAPPPGRCLTPNQRCTALNPTVNPEDADEQKKDEDSAVTSVCDNVILITRSPIGEEDKSLGPETKKMLKYKCMLTCTKVTDKPKIVKLIWGDAEKEKKRE